VAGSAHGTARQSLGPPWRVRALATTSAASIFQSTNDPETRNRFQYRMILKAGTRGVGVFLSAKVPAEAGEWVQGEGAWGFRRSRMLNPEGIRTAFRDEPEHHRSVATLAPRLCKRCSASSRETCPERSGGRMPLAEKGVRGQTGNDLRHWQKITGVGDSSTGEVRKFQPALTTWTEG
jgi:hypothetical protein